MDAQVDVLHGPRPLQSNGNVSVPRELLDAVGLVPGESKVHWALSPDLPGALLLIPSSQVARAMEAIYEAIQRRG